MTVDPTSPEFVYPIEPLAAMVDESAIEEYLGMLFGYAEWEGRVMGLRGIGDDGTPARDRNHKEPIWLHPDYERIGPKVTEHARRWAMWHVACFIVPATLRAEAEGSRSAAEAHVAEFTTILVDLDSGDTGAKLRYLEQAVGLPTMVVYSGGMTAEGHPKIHLYWKLTEPTDRVIEVGHARHRLALAAGGDPSFQRITQIIRVPGSIHSKHGNSKLVSIANHNRSLEYDFGELTERIAELRPMPGLPQMAPQISVPGQGYLDFSAGAVERRPLEATMTSNVRAGAVDAEDRWSAFNRVAGWNIHLVRQGRLSPQEAYEQTYGWMVAHMQPTWTAEHFEGQFKGLWLADLKEHGPMEAPTQRPPLQLAPTTPTTADGQAVGEPIEYALQPWSVSRLMAGPAPARRFLIDGMVLAGKPQLLVADGGVGKTFVCLSLGLAIACGPGTPWLCGKVAQAAAGMSVVMVTAEDDRDELHARIEALDPSGMLRRRAEDRFIVLPLPNAGGTFALVELDARRNPRPAEKWQQLSDEIAKVPNVGAVILDTYSSMTHGDENAANITNEWFRVATEPVCGRLGAALIATHHTRKGEKAISNAAEMREAIRGSGAMPNNVRAALGIWPEPAWKRELPLMGLPRKPHTLFKIAVIKANNPEMLNGAHPLVRSPSGALEYVPHAAALVSHQSANPARSAWLQFILEAAAEVGKPFCKTGKNGLYGRKGELPPALSSMTRNGLIDLTDELISRGKIVQTQPGLLDKPGGRFARGDLPPKLEAFTPPNYDRYAYDATLGIVVDR